MFAHRHDRMDDKRSMGHELGLVLNYKIPASGKPVDLSGAELVFIASAGGSAKYLSEFVTDPARKAALASPKTTGFLAYDWHLNRIQK